MFSLENSTNTKKINYYNLFRPNIFNEMIGIDEAKNLCINSIKKKIFPSLIIFFGSYGSGKTTLARIYAKAINCMGNIIDADKPCHKCQNCLNSNAFIFEYNSSNYTQIDHMRNVIENSQYKPYYGLYKIYILDEIHMLSTKSINMLLKEVEEPLPHVRYICITTHLDAIPETFISRAVTCKFNMLDKNTKLKAIDKLILKAQNLKIDFDISITTKILITLVENNLFVSYRDLVNKMITSFLYTEKTQQIDFHQKFIELVIDNHKKLKVKLDELQEIITCVENTESLLNNLFKYFMQHVIENNNVDCLELADMVVKNMKSAINNYNSLIVLISKIHFLLLD